MKKEKELKLNGKHIAPVDLEDYIDRRCKESPEFARAYKLESAKHRMLLLIHGMENGSQNLFADLKKLRREIEAL